MVVMAIGRAGTTESNRGLHLCRCFRDTSRALVYVESVGASRDGHRRCSLAASSTTTTVSFVGEKKRVGEAGRDEPEGPYNLRVQGKRREKKRRKGDGEARRKAQNNNPERVEVMIERWRIEASCPTTFLRVPSQGHSTPWNPETARSSRNFFVCVAGREESSQRYGKKEKKET